MTNYLLSRDGTRIAYSRIGKGAPLVLVDGALCHRKFGPNPALARRLQDKFTVYTYDRRGRSESGDTLPYEPVREIEDLSTLVREIGEPPFLYGISSGAALVLDALQKGLRAKKVAVYEAPFITDSQGPRIPRDFLSRIEQSLNQGQPDRALTSFFQQGIGLSPFVIRLMKWFPAWKSLKKLAHTLPYDLRILGHENQGNPLPLTRWNQVQIPTLVMAGSQSPAWMKNSMKEWSEILPQGSYEVLKGQDHRVSAAAMSRALQSWF